MGINFKNVDHMYPPFGKEPGYYALKNVSIEIDSNAEFIAILGHTGSGKSTLIQHMNALLLPTLGEVNIYDKRILPKNSNREKLKPIREKVGLVFQFPEYQLFEETVEKDVMFGPINFGVPKKEAQIRARQAIDTVGLGHTYLNRTPFNLSGGEMRRVALAGILAMEPQIIILDEPTVGLDPRGKTQIMDLFKDINEKYNKTIIMVTHDMDVVAKYAKRSIVLQKGNCVFDGSTKDLFSDIDKLKEYNLDLPETIKVMMNLKEKLNIEVNINQLSIDAIVEELERYYMVSKS